MLLYVHQPLYTRPSRSGLRKRVDAPCRGKTAFCELCIDGRHPGVYDFADPMLGGGLKKTRTRRKAYEEAGYALLCMRKPETITRRSSTSLQRKVAAA